MGLRAIHLYAGTGTMTRAFQKHGVDVVLAWEPDKQFAEVYRANFPEVSLVEGSIEEIDMSRIPKYDFLLAKIISPPVSVRTRSPQASRVLEVVEKTRPRVLCFFMSGWLGIKRLFMEQVIQTLSDWGYYVQYKQLDAKNFGGVPFNGRSIYVIAYRQESAVQEFAFPKQIGCKSLGAGYLDRRAEEEWKLYHRIPEEVREFMENDDAKSGAIYYYQRKITMEKGVQFQLVNCEYCPRLNQREWYRTYVQGERGVRRLSWREYLALQGDMETEFPAGMANTSIWNCLAQHGLYTAEYRIAERLVKVLEGVPDYDWRHEAAVPLYGVILHPEQRGELSVYAETQQAFSLEVFRDSLWAENGQKPLVVVEGKMQMYTFLADLYRLRSACIAHPKTAAKELGIEEDILLESLAEGGDFLLPAADWEDVQKFKRRKRGIGVAVSRWQGMEMPELSTVYLVGHRDYRYLPEIADCITRPYGEKGSAKIVFCGCGYTELFSEGIIEEWPQTQKLVQTLWQGNCQKGNSVVSAGSGEH